ncbi:MAG: hypothetical protein LBR88_02160 [Zoogloeaceae bacterium]|jgi:hypothetical protein|nr:hypothetical protein [Zoogloeaceae bacterium]
MLTGVTTLATTALAAPPPPVEVDTRLTVRLDKGLLLQGQNTQVTGGAARIDTGNVLSGAP